MWVTASSTGEDGNFLEGEAVSTVCKTLGKILTYALSGSKLQNIAKLHEKEIASTAENFVFEYIGPYINQPVDKENLSSKFEETLEPLHSGIEELKGRIVKLGGSDPEKMFLNEIRSLALEKIKENKVNSAAPFMSLIGRIFPVFNEPILN